MVGVVYGVYLVSKTKIKKEAFTNHIMDSKQVVKKQTRSVSWVILAICGGLSMSMKDILTKKAFLSNNLDIMTITWNICVAQCIIVMMYDRFTTGTFAPKDKNNDHKIDIKDWGIIMWTGILFALYNFGVAAATKTAPNVGYAKSIVTFSIIISTITAHYLYKSALTTKSMVGVIIIVSSIILISIM